MKLEIISNSSLFINFLDDSMIATQIIVIDTNGSVIVKDYLLSKKIIRDKIYIFSPTILKELILSVKDALEKQKTDVFITDVGDWKINIAIDNDKYCYNGFLIEEDNPIKINNKTISNYIRSILKIENLLLLDGNNESF